MNIKAIRKAALLAAATITASALVPTSAFAAETFNFLGSYTGGSNYGNVLTFSNTTNTNKVEVSGYSLSGTSNSSSVEAGKVVQYLGGSAGQYGLGVTNGAYDLDHEIDNNGRIDFLILQFENAISITDLAVYGFGDTDLTWAVGTTATPFLGTLAAPTTFAQLDGMFGAFQSSAGPNSNILQNRTISGAASGNLFLVASSFTGGSDDQFKLNSLKGNVAAVPEPATWGMMIGGFALAGSAMRRRKANTAVSFA